MTDPFYDWSSIRPMPSRRGSVSNARIHSIPPETRASSSAVSGQPLASALSETAGDDASSFDPALSRSHGDARHSSSAAVPGVQRSPLYPRTARNLAAGRFVHRTDDELTGGFFLISKGNER